MDAPMVQHFVDKQYDSYSFKFIVLDIKQVEDKGGNIYKKLAQQELFWIFKLHTQQPSGLNTHLDFLVYLYILLDQ